MSLPADLAAERDRIRAQVLDYGLDFFEVIYEVLDFQKMNEVASYMGFPTRYPHWRFGMEYERMRKSYAYGLHRIYEMVINNDPCYAYLLESNAPVDQKIVMAHVYAHADFFKNNLWFAHTNRKMMDEMANHATRVRQFIDRHGLDEVEEFIDICLSLDNLIDIHAPYVRRPPETEQEADQGEDEVRQPVRLPSKGYMDRFINPPEELRKEARRLAEEAKARKRRFPVEPQKDVVLFLLHHAPLDSWQQEILSIIREEAYYFAPQGMTKIMNEGWASYWHTTIMTKSGVMKPAEVVDYADHHSGTVATSRHRINPYKIGLELFRDIEERWNTGRFGKEYEECEDREAKATWNRQLGLGREKVFEVRRVYNDVGFIDTFFTEEFCQRNKLFTYTFNERTGQYEIDSRDFRAIKQKLLFSLTNLGQPYIEVVDANFRNRGELYLKHRHEGVDLQMNYSRDTLTNLYRIWTRPVHLETVLEGTHRLLTYDGRDHSMRKIA
jgi:stage V sporulation protein R